MEHYAGIDVSLESASVCVRRRGGNDCPRAKMASEPVPLIAWFQAPKVPPARIGLEAGPLSQWLYAAMKEAGLEVELLGTRHVRGAFKTMPEKTDRTDARHRPADEARLVSGGALQVAGDVRSPENWRPRLDRPLLTRVVDAAPI